MRYFIRKLLSYTTTGVVFINVSKAFDKIWHEGILFKLKVTNTPKCLFNAAGVPHDPKLGPILFNIFISNVGTSVTTHTTIYNNIL